jgi:glycosyltransferase involved in cell wall biosynthesis
MRRKEGKILFIGNLPGKNLKSVGGANNYSFFLYEKLKSKNIDVDFMEIRKLWCKFGQIIDYPIFLVRFLFCYRKYDIISIHATTDFHLTLGIIISFFLNQLSKKKLIYHFYGGIFHKYYDAHPKIIQKIVNKSIFSSNKILMETKSMISYFEKRNFANFKWFPNSREPNLTIKNNNNFSKKFVFISRVTKSKGVLEILEVFKNLGQDYQVDFFGPLDNKHFTKEHLENDNTSYKGVLNSNEVIEVLEKYDVLLLPTFHKGEGYPGIIIEGFSIGVPVISTTWGAIPEIIENNKNGILVEPESIDELRNAVLSFNESNYLDFSENALVSFKDFDLNKNIEDLINFYFD